MSYLNFVTKGIFVNQFSNFGRTLRTNRIQKDGIFKRVFKGIGLQRLSLTSGDGGWRD